MKKALLLVAGMTLCLTGCGAGVKPEVLTALNAAYDGLGAAAHFDCAEYQVQIASIQAQVDMARQLLK